jgi:hypothetical protein
MVYTNSKRPVNSHTTPNPVYGKPDERSIMIAFILNTVLMVVLLLFAPASSAAQTAKSDEPSADKPRQLNIAVKPWTGDFDKMVTRRTIRVLVPYSAPSISTTRDGSEDSPESAYATLSATSIRSIKLKSGPSRCT